MIFLIVMAFDPVKVALAFLDRLGLDRKGCVTRVLSATDQSNVSISGGPDQGYAISMDAAGRVFWAQNDGLIYRRIHKMDKGKLLSEVECRKRLDELVKRLPLPTGYGNGHFQVIPGSGNASLAFDRKVAGYWVGSMWRYSVDLRTGAFQSFYGEVTTVGNTELRIDMATAKASALKALAALKPSVGPQKLARKMQGFQHHRVNGTDYADLGYEFTFEPAVSNPHAFYRCTHVLISGRDGSILTPPQQIEMKSVK